MKKKILICIAIIVFIFAIILTSEIITANSEYGINEKNLQIPIFTYHHLVQDENEIEDGCMETTIDKFKEQMTGIMNLGYKPITYEKLKEYSEGKTKIPGWSFLVTFDDGYSDFYTYVYPIAKEYNIPITVFVIDDCMETPGYLTWEQAKEMNDSGIISVYSHGLHHIEYNKEEPERLVNETNEAYTYLEERLEKSILKVFAYPYGLASEEHIKAMADAGYIENLMDNRINLSKSLNINALHRCYPCNDSALKMIIKQYYRAIRYR